MPKCRECNMKEMLFKFAGNWNKYIVIKILRDEIPRTLKQITNEFLIIEQGYRATVSNSVQSLIRDKTLILNEITETYTISNTVLPRVEFTIPEIKILKSVKEHIKVSKQNLIDLTEINDEEEFDIALTSLQYQFLKVEKDNDISYISFK